jgi:hypothetical protein
MLSHVLSSAMSFHRRSKWTTMETGEISSKRKTTFFIIIGEKQLPKGKTTTTTTATNLPLFPKLVFPLLSRQGQKSALLILVELGKGHHHLSSFRIARKEKGIESSALQSLAKGSHRVAAKKLPSLENITKKGKQKAFNNFIHHK